MAVTQAPILIVVPIPNTPLKLSFSYPSHLSQQIGSEMLENIFKGVLQICLCCEIFVLMVQTCVAFFYFAFV